MSTYNRPQGQGYVTDSFSSDAGSSRKIVNHTLRPVTIKQLLSITQTEDFKIDGHEVSQVTFVAVVRTINRQSTHTTYSLEDGTGSIDARKFPTLEGDDSADMNTIVENSYVRIAGALKHLNERFSVNIHAIRPIQDMNELTYHNLEVMYVHVSLTRPKNDGAAMSGISSSSHNNYGGQNMTGAGSIGSGAGGADRITQSISDMIRNHPEAAKGVNRREIITRFAPVLGSTEAVNALLNNLIDGGCLYHTEDEDHFMTAL